MTASDNGLTGERAFNLALRMAIDASVDHIAAEKRLADIKAETDKFHAEFTSLALSRDAMRRERDSLRSELAHFRTSLKPLSTLYDVAERARRALDDHRMISGQEAEELRLNLRSELQKALQGAFAYCDQIPF